jgi:hypothetical protein
MQLNAHSFAFAMALLLLVGSGAPIAQGEVILSTDFTGRTVSGDTAQNITWSVNGVSDPGDLTAVDINNAAPPTFVLFDTANAQGHFAPNLNVGNEGPWSTTIPLTLTTSNISLKNVVLDWQHFTNTGSFQGASRSVDWTVSVTGSSSGPVGSITGNVNGTSGVKTLTFALPVELDNTETWDMKVLASSGSATGNQSAVPTPIDDVGLRPNRRK